MKKGNVKLTLSVNKDLLGKYKQFCKREGFTISGQIEKFMNTQLKNKNVWESIFGK